MPAIPLKRFYRRGDRLWWLCPGCEQWHGVPTSPTKTEKHWRQTGDDETPTLYPSLKCTMGPEGERRVCHFHLKGGRVDFCDDSFHELAGEEQVEVPQTPHFLWHEWDDDESEV